ncbi:MAG: hypothetical protein AB7O56_05950 [Bauldia sp.]
MSTPLDLAVDIAGTLMRHRRSAAPLNVAIMAAEISDRHSGTGYSTADIAAALTEEGHSVGITLKAVPGR